MSTGEDCQQVLESTETTFLHECGYWEHDVSKTQRIRYNPRNGAIKIHVPKNLNPVSYTHLDVYKRQQYSPISF